MLYYCHKLEKYVYGNSSETESIGSSDTTANHQTAAAEKYVRQKSRRIFFTVRTNSFRAFENPKKCWTDHRREKRLLYALPGKP